MFFPSALTYMKWEGDLIFITATGNGCRFFKVSLENWWDCKWGAGSSYEFPLQDLDILKLEGQKGDQEIRASDLWGEARENEAI